MTRIRKAIPTGRLTVVVALTLLVAATGNAQPAATAPSLVSAAELAARLYEPTLVLLHVGSSSNYEQAHIRGARHVTPATLSAPRGEGRLTLELPTDEDLRLRLAALGIGSASRIVVCYDNDWMSQATRVIFTLDYAGFGAQTQLLDGGLAAWKESGQPVTNAPTPPVTSPVEVTMSARTGAVISFDEMVALTRAPQAHGTSKTVIIDARASDFYTGANDRRGEIPRPGHVPGAVNLPYTEFFERQAGAEGPLVLKPRAALEEMFSAAGITRGTALVTYCHIGQQATVPFLVARLLGYDVRLFDGSFEEWSASGSVPVAK